MTDRAEIIEKIEILEELARRKKYNQLKKYAPYQKQKEFHAAKESQKLLGAGNQLGKTYAGAAEAAYHSTGLYPEWWEGRRFLKPTVGWVGGVSGEVIRDTTQKMLVGRVQDSTAVGTGLIPRDCIIDLSRS